MLATDLQAAEVDLNERLARWPGVARRLQNLDAGEIARLYGQCQVAVTACSTSALEAMCCGAPVIALRWADNQRVLAEALSAAGVVVCEQATDLTGALRRPFVASPACDGLGAWRVAAALGVPITVPLPPPSQAAATVREAGPGDAVVVWLLNTLADNRRWSHRTDPIAWAEHLAWWNGREGDRILLAEIGGCAYACARVHRGLVDIVVHPVARRRGLGRLLLTSLAHRHPKPLTAEIAEGNMASRDLFSASGYAPVGSTKAGFLRFTRDHGNASEPASESDDGTA